MNNCRTVEHRNSINAYRNTNQSTKHRYIPHVISPRNVSSLVAATRSFKFMIFITFESCDKTGTKIEKNWFLLVHRVAKNSEMNKKIQKHLSGRVL